MKKLILAAVAMLAVYQSQASLTVDFGTQVGANGGGPFQVKLNSTTTFLTFCVEDDVYVTPGTRYYGSIDKDILSGGAPGHWNGSPITIGTAYLYSSWLAGHDHLATVSDTDVQTAIWNLQGYHQWQISQTAADFLSQLHVNPTDPANGAYGVYALNLWTRSDLSGDAQSQLIAVPEPATFVAGALVLLPFGFSMARSIRKKS